MDVKDRIRQLRKLKKMNREEFGKALGFSSSGAVANMELGRAPITDDRINLICEKFDVNKQWLLTGEGSMLMPMNKTEEIAKVVGEIMKQSDDSFKKRFIAMIAALEPEDWELLEKIAKKLNEPE